MRKRGSGRTRRRGRKYQAPGDLHLSLVPHLFIPLISHVSEQLHYHLNDGVLWKRGEYGESFQMHRERFLVTVLDPETNMGLRCSMAVP